MTTSIMTTPQDNGGAAFPAHLHGERYGGMSLRDYFAAAALQGLLASGHFTAEAGYDGDQSWMTSHEDPWDDETGEKIHEGRRRFDFPEAAWKCADAMLAARKEGA
jgi:hypothetical protein